MYIIKLIHQLQKRFKKQKQFPGRKKLTGYLKGLIFLCPKNIFKSLNANGMTNMGKNYLPRVEPTIYWI
jgi:hypothetical protein